MNYFTIFVIVLTIAYVIYYAINIAIDRAALLKKKADEAETIDADNDVDDGYTHHPKKIVEDPETGEYRLIEPTTSEDQTAEKTIQEAEEQQAGSPEEPTAEPSAESTEFSEETAEFPTNQTEENDENTAKTTETTELSGKSTELPTESTELPFKPTETSAESGEQSAEPTSEDTKEHPKDQSGNTNVGQHPEDVGDSDSSPDGQKSQQTLDGNNDVNGPDDNYGLETTTYRPEETEEGEEEESITDISQAFDANLAKQDEEEKNEKEKINPEIQQHADETNDALESIITLSLNKSEDLDIEKILSDPELTEIHNIQTRYEQTRI